MAFDTATLSKARESGYSDEEVSQFVVQSDPRVKTALDSGYTLDEVASFLDQKGKPKPQEDTLKDDWSGFVANMQIAGNRLLQNVTVSRMNNVAKIQKSAQLARQAADLGTPEAFSAYAQDRMEEFGMAGFPKKDPASIAKDADILERRWRDESLKIPEFATYISEKEKRVQELTPSLSPEMKKFNETQGKEFWSNFAANPIESLSNVIGSSLIVSSPALVTGAVGSLAGPVGTAIGAGAGSYNVEVASSLMDVLRETGVDITNPDEVGEAFTDPKKMEMARDLANKRGVPVAIFDAASAGLAGKFISPLLKEVISPGAKQILKATGKELALQATAGATGEAAAEFLSGQELSGKEIAIEGIAAIASGPSEVISNIRARNKIDTEIQKIFTAEPTSEIQLPQTNAVQEQQTAEVYGNVPEQPREVQAPVPAEEGTGGVPPSPAEQPQETKQVGEVLYPTTELNFRGGEGVSPNEVTSVTKTTNEQGKEVFAIRYTKGGESFVGYSDNPAWELQAKPPGKGLEFVGTAIKTPQGVATGEAQGTAHPEIMGKAIDEGTPIEEMESSLGFAFRKPDGTVEWVDRVEAGRRLTESGQLTGLKPGTKLTSEHIRGEVEGVKFNPTPKITEDQAAETLQPFFEKAVAAARAAGATDPETAASQAQIELSQQVAQGKTKLDNPEALFSQAATLKARNQLTASQAQKRGGGVAPESLETSGAATTQGPRSELLSQEDEQQITGAIDSLPDTQKKVMGALVGNPDATDKEIAAQTGLSEDQVNRAKKAAQNTLKQFIIDQGLGRSLGPGAASVDEVLAVYEERKFGKRLQASELEPEIKKDIGDRYYEVIPNRVTAKRATELIEENGEESIEEQIRDEKSTISYADRNTVGQILIKRYNEQYKSLKDSNPEEARRVLDKAVNLAEWAQDFGTRLGQGVQAFAMWSRLTPEGKLRTFKKLVDKKRKEFTRNNRTDIDEIKDITNSDAPKAEKVRKLKSLKSRVGKKIKSRAERLIDASKDGLTDEKFFTVTSDVLGLPVFSPEVSAEIMRLALLVDQAPEGMPKMEATLNLNRFIAEQKGFDPGDLPLGIYYGNILSGVNTQAINLVDTSLNVLNEVSTLAIQNPRAALEIMSGMLRGFATGRFDAATAILQGRRISDGKFVEDPFFMEIARFGEKGGVPIKTATRTGRVLKTIAESKAAIFLRGYKYVGRLMSASDALAFRGAQEAKSAQLAWQIAQDPEAPSVSEILGYDRLPEYLKQAQSEGYTGSQMQARATELMLMSRPEAIQKASTDFASEATYNVKPYGFMGIVSNTIEGLTRKVPALKIVVPFTRIVGNVVNRGLNNSPWGYVRALTGKAGTEKDPRTFKEYSPEERNALLIRATIGTTAIVTATVLHQLGYLTIHGAGPSDPDKKKQLRQTGWKPYTIQIGDKYFSYTYTPFGLAMAATGNFLDNEKYQDFSSKEGLDRFTYAFQSIASTIFNQSFLSGLSTFFDIIAGKSPAQQITSFRRFAANTVSSFAVPFSSALKDLEAIATDPNIPKVDNLRQAIVANIPFASQALKPQLNALGEPIKASRNRLFSEQGNDPVWKLVADKQLRIPVPNQFFDDPDGQYEYVQKQGKLLRTWLEANLSSLRNMDTENAQDAIERASDSFRQRTRNELLNRGIRKKENK